MRKVEEYRSLVKKLRYLYGVYGAIYQENSETARALKYSADAIEELLYLLNPETESAVVEDEQMSLF